MAMTAEEIRKILINAVSQNGGHLASSLGAVELAIALTESFDPFRDRIIWDVGHQAYAWKILTGRANEFATLRKFGGISGFPNPNESYADAAIAGHAGVAISLAEGFATARDLRGSNEYVVAVIGDASISNGTSFEALNSNSSSKIIVILNDNGMSISKATGSLSRYLGRLIASSRYNRLKDAVKRIEGFLKIFFLDRAIRRVKGFLKKILISGAYFEQMGFRYMGPVDGHNIDALKTALNVAKREDRSVLLHIVTKKGFGFKPAMENPTKWHGVGPFDLAKANEKVVATNDKNPSMAWSDIMGNELVAIAEKDSRVVAITSAMKDGTGLNEFASRFPNRFHDVGISEGHMVAFAGGLAAGGMRPVVAIYSTFLQRAIDQVMHDVCIANLPVVFCVDRAGVVGADGATHQGVFDVAMLRSLPNLKIYQPKDAEDLRELLRDAISRDGPTVIRYPRGKARETFSAPSFRDESRVAIFATGDWFEKACAVATRVGGVAIHLRSLKPLDLSRVMEERKKNRVIVSMENASLIGGVGEAMNADLKFGWPDVFIPHGDIKSLEKSFELDEDSIVATIEKFLAMKEKGEK